MRPCIVALLVLWIHMPIPQETTHKRASLRGSLSKDSLHIRSSARLRSIQDTARSRSHRHSVTRRVLRLRHQHIMGIKRKVERSMGKPRHTLPKHIDLTRLRYHSQERALAYLCQA